MSFSNNNNEGESQYINSISGIAISNKSILILSTIGFGILGLVLYCILRRLTDQPTNQDDNEERDYGEILNDSDVATLNRAQRRARAKYRMKNARRVAQPVQVNNNGEDGEEDDNENQDNVPQVNINNLSRKERQRAAKKKEREERKVSAEEARKWREKNQSKSIKKSIDKNIKPDESKEVKALSVEDVFPQRANVNDALSEYIFRESIVKNIKQMDVSNDDEMISIANQIPKMTIHEFVERLKQNGSIAISSLADEFDITEQECLDQLECINKQHGIIGIVDSNGCFVYVSMEMIKEAIKLGNDLGRIVCPKSSPLAVNQSDQDECLAANET